MFGIGVRMVIGAGLGFDLAIIVAAHDVIKRLAGDQTALPPINHHQTRTEAHRRRLPNESLKDFKYYKCSVCKRPFARYDRDWPCSKGCGVQSAYDCKCVKCGAEAPLAHTEMHGELK